MSIAVLAQVYTEARRLAVAGSVVARGDFRLKKLLPPLEQAGKQAPVFAKVAEAATAVIDGPEESSAAALLELTSLVNAVMYTQGETGLVGELAPFETTDLGGTASQTSARVLKQLLEALSSTGSGRWELVKDAHERGLFRDLRLVKPALQAIDDPFSEIADLIAEKVLPLYGKAILPEVRAKYDPKGTKGHPRRLALMHALDPAGTRELVKAALDGGSKEVRVAAVSCLGADPEDLQFLIEQASAKAQDVRAAAYRALAGVDRPEAVAVLAKGVAGKDYQMAANAVEASKSPKLIDVLVKEIRTAMDGLPKLKDKKAVTASVERVLHLIHSFPDGEYPAEDALLLELFARRHEIAKTKGDGESGADIGEAVITAMGTGSKAMQEELIAAREELDPEELTWAFIAGRDILSPAQLYETFSPYVAAKVDEKKKAKDPAWAKREVILDSMDDTSQYYSWHDDDDDLSVPELPYDARWLDHAMSLGRLSIVHALAPPGHPGAQAFAMKAFEAALKKAKSPEDVHEELIGLIRLQHPGATEAFFAALAKRGKKATYHHHWFTRLVPRLPKDAIPRLEEMVAAMPENEANHWLDAIQELRTRE